MVSIINELFPSATSKDICLTKTLLVKYKRLKNLVVDFEKNNGHDQQQVAYSKAKEATHNIERAVNLILDVDTRRIIEYRYLKGHSYKVTILHFNSTMADRTIDRKIIDGIESVANTLKLWGELE